MRDYVKMIAQDLVHQKIKDIIDALEFDIDVDELVDKELDGDFARKVKAEINNMLDPSLYAREIDIWFSERYQLGGDAFEMKFAPVPDGPAPANM